jgi:hypothetical protein
MPTADFGGEVRAEQSQFLSLGRTHMSRETSRGFVSLTAPLSPDYS